MADLNRPNLQCIMCTESARKSYIASTYYSYILIYMRTTNILNKKDHALL